MTERIKLISPMNVEYSAIRDEERAGKEYFEPESELDIKLELQRVQRAKARVADSSGFYVYHVLAVFFFYVLTCAEVYHYLDGVHRLDSVYFVMITFTTIGYGDIVPQHPFSKLFTCIFVFINLMIVGQLLDYVITVALERRQQASQDQMERLLDEDSEGDESRESGAQLTKAREDLNPKLNEVPLLERWLGKEYCALCEAFSVAIIKVLATILVGTIAIAFVFDGHPVVDAFYWSCMTVSTVGFGDIVPSNEYARAFACIYSVAGCLMFGSAVSGFLNAVNEFRLLAKNEDQLNNSMLDYETFLNADTDGSGGVSRAEFVLYRLTQMGIIPEALRKRAEMQFDRMDTDGSGELTMEDIIMHQNRHKSPEYQRRLIDHYHQEKVKRALSKSR